MIKAHFLMFKLFFMFVLIFSPIALADPVGPCHLYANNRTYHGHSGDKYHADSIWNKYGKYGSKYSVESVWNEYGSYGSKYSGTSFTNTYAKPGYIECADGQKYIWGGSAGMPQLP